MAESGHEKTQLQMKFEPRENSWFHRHSDMSWPAKFACKTAVRSTAELIAKFFLHSSLSLNFVSCNFSADFLPNTSVSWCNLAVTQRCQCPGKHPCWRMSFSYGQEKDGATRQVRPGGQKDALCSASCRHIQNLFKVNSICTHCGDDGGVRVCTLSASVICTVK